MNSEHTHFKTEKIIKLKRKDDDSRYLFQCIYFSFEMNLLIKRGWEVIELLSALGRQKTCNKTFALLCYNVDMCYHLKCKTF